MQELCRVALLGRARADPPRAAGCRSSSEPVCRRAGLDESALACAGACSPFESDSGTFVTWSYPPRLPRHSIADPTGRRLFDLASMMDGDVLPRTFVVPLGLSATQSRPRATCRMVLLSVWSQERSRRDTPHWMVFAPAPRRPISALGSGFLSHPAISELRDALRSASSYERVYYTLACGSFIVASFSLVADYRSLLFDPRCSTRECRLAATTALTPQKRLRRLANFAGSNHSDLYKMPARGAPCDAETWNSRRLPIAFVYHALGASYLWSGRRESYLGTRAPNAAAPRAARAPRNARRPWPFACCRLPATSRRLRNSDSFLRILLELAPKLNFDAFYVRPEPTAPSARAQTSRLLAPEQPISCLSFSARPGLKEGCLTPEADFQDQGIACLLSRAAS